MVGLRCGQYDGGGDGWLPPAASQICEELLSVINHGATELIADMTATISCEHAGAAAVGRAYQGAAIHGAQLRAAAVEELVVDMPCMLLIVATLGQTLRTRGLASTTLGG